MDIDLVILQPRGGHDHRIDIVLSSLCDFNDILAIEDRDDRIDTDLSLFKLDLDALLDRLQSEKFRELVSGSIGKAGNAFGLIDRVCDERKDHVFRNIDASVLLCNRDVFIRHSAYFSLYMIAVYNTITKNKNKVKSTFIATWEKKCYNAVSSCAAVQAARREDVHMEGKIMLCAFLFLVGWLWYYLFVRQFIYNFTVAFPLIRNMQAANKDLISSNAKKYTTISVIVSFLICAVITAIVVFLCRKHIYYIISFFAGGVLALVMFYKLLSIRNKSNFESFCAAYYRFVPDDELRTAMFNKKIPAMKTRLHEMEIPSDFIPEFVKEGK